MDRIVQFQNALGGQRVPVLLNLRARPILDHSGKPLVVAGNNALVARLKRTDGSDLALRIVSSAGNGRDWAVRYRALQGLDSSLVGRTVPAGIRVIKDDPVLRFQDGADELAAHDPAIVMQWFEGPTLLQAVDRAARAGKTSVLQALATAVVDVVNALGSASFAHGDLTASNLIVRTDGRLACVDLDTASWPDSALGASGHGSPGYRHPNESSDAIARDLFALLVMYTSLRVLGDDPDLRRSYGDPVSAPDGALLFSAWDLLDPSTSRCFMEVAERIEAGTMPLLNALRSACTGSIDDLGRHLPVIPRLNALSIHRSSRQPSAWNLDGAVDRIRARYGGADRAAPGSPVERSSEMAETQVNPSVSGWGTSHGWTTWESTPDASHDPTVEDVTEDDRVRLVAALDRNNEAEIARLWARLKDDPIAAMQGGRVEASLVAGYQRRLSEEASRGRDRAVVVLAEEAAARQLPLGTECRVMARAARERLEVRASLDKAVAIDDREQLADLAVSGKLVVLGDTDRRSLQRVLRAIEWPALQHAIRSNDDNLILEAFDPDLFGDMSDLGEGVKARIQLAERRVDWLSQVRSALKKRQVQDLGRLFTEPPEGGTERLSAPERRRIRQSIERRAALEELGSVIRSQDDAAIIAALNRVERVGARISDRFAWGVIQRVVERVSVIEDLIEAAEANPVDYGRLAQLLPIVRALGLARDPRLAGDLAIERLDAHVVRIAHVRRIRAALSRDNDVAIMVAAVPDPHGALDELTEEERDRVARAILARRRVDRKSVDQRVAP